MVLCDTSKRLEFIRPAKFTTCKVSKTLESALAALRGHITAPRFPRGMASPESWFHPILAPRSPQRVGREGEWGCSIRASLAFAMHVPRGFYRPTTVWGACQTPYYATAVTAPSRPATAEAAAGFGPRATLAGYRSPSRGLVLLPPGGFSRQIRRAFAEMTG